MPDAYSRIAELPPEVVAGLVHAMETRAASPKMRTMLDAYLSHEPFQDAARVLEIGCGSGPISAVLAQRAGIASVVGVDPSPVMLAKGRELRGHLKNLSLQEGDGRSLSFDDGSFDAVVVHTTLTHVPGADRVLSEAFRVLHRGGWLAVFDGDYETITISNNPNDPLAACIQSFKEAFVNDLWLARRLPALISAAGFRVMRCDSHSYLETSESDSELARTKISHLLTIVDRGADALATRGFVGNELAAALKTEARRRVDSGEFFGHVVYVSVIAEKPA